MNTLPGLNAAAKVCGTFRFESKKKECISAIGQGYVFDEGVAELCTTFGYESDKLKCLVAATGKQYLKAVVEQCKKESFTSRRIECLAKSGRAVWAYPFDSDTTKCESLSYSSNRRQCLSLIGSSVYISIPAVDVCYALSYENQKLSCLAGIVSRVIAEEEAKVCKGLTYGADKVACLHSIQRTYP